MLLVMRLGMSLMVHITMLLLKVRKVCFQTDQGLWQF